MATQIRHGPHPHFTVKTYGRFSLTLVGHYTDVADDPNFRRTRRGFLLEFWRWLQSWWTEVEPDIQGLGAGGVTEVRWSSDQREKRANELLVMRTVFRDFYERTMRELGHQPKGAYRL